MNDDFHIYQVFGIFLPLFIAIIGSLLYQLYLLIKHFITRGNKNE